MNSTLKLRCPECGKRMELSIHPGERARLHGHPDQQHPGEDPSIDDGEECVFCGYELSDRERDRALAAWEKQQD